MKTVFVSPNSLGSDSWHGTNSCCQLAVSLQTDGAVLCSFQLFCAAFRGGFELTETGIDTVYEFPTKCSRFWPLRL